MKDLKDVGIGEALSESELNLVAGGAPAGRPQKRTAAATYLDQTDAGGGPRCETDQTGNDAPILS